MTTRYGDVERVSGANVDHDEIIDAERKEMVASSPDLCFYIASPETNELYQRAIERTIRRALNVALENDEDGIHFSPEYLDKLASDYATVSMGDIVGARGMLAIRDYPILGRDITVINPTSREQIKEKIQRMLNALDGIIQTRFADRPTDMVNFRFAEPHTEKGLFGLELYNRCMEERGVLKTQRDAVAGVFGDKSA